MSTHTAPLTPATAGRTPRAPGDPSHTDAPLPAPAPAAPMPSESED